MVAIRGIHSARKLSSRPDGHRLRIQAGRERDVVRSPMRSNLQANLIEDFGDGKTQIC